MQSEKTTNLASCIDNYAGWYTFKAGMSRKIVLMYHMSFFLLLFRKTSCIHLSSSLFLLAALFSLAACQHQTSPQNEVIATVGMDKISKDAFFQRAELSPAPRPVVFEGKSGNAALLERLIGEKLMAQAARSAKLDTSLVYREQLRAIQLEAAIRAMLEDELQKEASVDSNEVRAAIQKSNRLIQVALFKSTSRAFVQQFHSLLEQGLPFRSAIDSLYSQPVDPALYTETVSWGQMEPALEQVLFAMQTGEHSSIVAFSQGFAVLQKIEEHFKPRLTEYEILQKYSTVEKVLSVRKYNAAANRYVGQMLNEKNVTVKNNILRIVLDRLAANESEFDQATPQQTTPDTKIPNDHFKKKYETALQQPLVVFSGGLFTLEEILLKLWARGVDLTAKPPDERRAQILADIKFVVENEILGEIALQKGFGDLPAVHNEVQMWRDYFLTQHFMASTGILPGAAARDTFPDTVRTLRQNADISINHALLDSLHISPIQMSVIRPGRMARLAVPPWPQF